MNRTRQMLRRCLTAVAVLSCLIILLTAPIFISGRHDDLALKGATVFAASHDSYRLSSPVRLLEAPMIELESGTLSIPPTRTGLARSGEVLAMLITGNRSRIALREATFTADFSGGGTTFSQGTAGGVAPLVANLQGLHFDTLTVRDSAIRLKMSDSLTLSLDELTADVTSMPDGVIHAQGSFVLRGEKVTFDTTFGTKLNAESGSQLITASLESPLLTASLDGHFIIGENPRLLSQQAELSIPNLRDAASWLGVNWPPGRGLEDFHAAGKLEWVNGTVAFQKATMQMDGNEASGTLSANFSGEKPAIDGTLGLKTLDLSKYFAASDDAKQPSDQSLLSLVSTASGLNFPLIRTLDADLRISANRVIIPGITIGRSAATVSLKEGKMLADVAELEIDDGTRGEGQLRIDATGAVPSYGIRGKLQALDLGGAAQAIFGHATVQGRGDATIDISATGDTGESLLGSLDGKLCVTLADGGRIGLDIDQLSAAMKSTKSQGAWTAASTSAMPVDKLDASFELVNGVIRTESAQATVGERAVAVEGDINLAARDLDLSFVIGDRPAADAAKDAKPEAREVIDMRGPWTEPNLQPGLVPRAPMLPAPQGRAMGPR